MYTKPACMHIAPISCVLLWNQFYLRNHEIQRVISQHSTELLLITFDSTEQSELLGSYVRHVHIK